MKILFVDDELYFMQPYVEAFQKIADVVVVNTAVEAMKKIDGNAKTQQYACLVLDIMMPPPNGWEARTDNGLLTGVEVLKECRDEILAVELPVLILTNHKLDKIKSKVEALKFPKGLIVVRAKLETPAFHAVMCVDQLAAKWKAAK